MIITEKIIEDIFNLKLKLSDNDKISLSKYQEYIPMYDIYEQEITLINKKRIYYKLMNADFRFVSNEIVMWLKNLYKKNKLVNKDLANKLKKNLKILENYDINILLDTSYKTFYQYSIELGLLISICKRKSFENYIYNIKPYYTKLELIKLGQNMNLIQEEINIEQLSDQNYLYMLCKKISKNDICFDEIKSHSLHIIDQNIISYITFYSYYGSFLYNNILRNEKYINNFLYDGIKKIVNVLKTSTPLYNKYYLYRFIWDDSFIHELKIGQTIIDNGFISTTRDPFYSPGLNKNFGLTLIKINIPKDTIGVGLLIEHFSLFAKEQEFLLPPNTKLKLLSKNDNFKYYHINESFEKMITKKYEFEYINSDFNKIYNFKIKDNIKIIDDFKNYELYGESKIALFKSFINDSSYISIKLNNKKYMLVCMFFDSTDNSSYSRLYYNQIKDGLLISIYYEGYPYLNIECGDELVVNYLNKFYFYGNDKEELSNELLDIVLEIGRIFYYKEAKIFYNYRNYAKFNYNDKYKLFLYTHFYNHTLYDYLKNKNKFITNPFLKNNLGWYEIDNIFKKEISEHMKKKLKLTHDNLRDAFIYIVEEGFTKYRYFMKILDIDKDCFFIFEIYEKLKNDNRIAQFKSNILYAKEESLGDDFKLIFRQPIRRY